MEAPHRILIDNGVRPTVNAVAVLAIFIGKNRSFSHTLLMGLLSGDIKWGKPLQTIIRPG